MSRLIRVFHKTNEKEKYFFYSSYSKLVHLIEADTLNSTKLDSQNFISPRSTSKSILFIIN